jgi:hypothetical protein
MSESEEKTPLELVLMVAWKFRRYVLPAAALIIIAIYFVTSQVKLPTPSSAINDTEWYYYGVYQGCIIIQAIDTNLSGEDVQSMIRGGGAIQQQCFDMVQVAIVSWEKQPLADGPIEEWELFWHNPDNPLYTAEHD